MTTVNPCRDWPSPLDDAAAAAAWSDAWRTLGLAPPGGERERLEAAWSEPQRHYHALGHLRECLAWLARWRSLAARPAEVALALWYHDAVYQVRAHDNEAASAAWARSSLRGAGARMEVADRVHALVMATAHDAPAVGDDASLLVDIDLSILGAPAARFARYDADIRREYAWVDEGTYRARRAQVLARFLAAPSLYRTPVAAHALDAAARLNLGHAIEALR